MLISIIVETERLENGKYFSLNDQNRRIDFVALKGHSEHTYTNIPVNDIPNIVWGPTREFEILSFSEKPYFSPEQEAKNGDLTSIEGVNYRLEVRGNPKFAVVSFPHLPGPGGWKTPFPVLDGAKSIGLDDCLYISFQDAFLSYGSYLLTDNFGKSPVPTVVNIINETIRQYSISKSDISFIGGSKGGNIAVLVSQYFPNSQVIAAAYQMNLPHFLEKSDNKNIQSAFDFFQIKVPNFAQLMLDQADNQDVHWIYSLNDHLSNGGYEDHSSRNLHKIPTKASHSRVLPESLPYIREVIYNRYL